MSSAYSVAELRRGYYLDNVRESSFHPAALPNRVAFLSQSRTFPAQAFSLLIFSLGAVKPAGLGAKKEVPVGTELSAKRACL